MIVDVADLKFETLQFSRAYDQNRYLRGRKIYNDGDAEVTSVDKIANDEFYIEAFVKGNYDDYDTTLKIKGQLINEWSCTCEDYINGNLCKHIIATSMEVIKPHYASTSEGIRKMEQNRIQELKKQREEENKKYEYERKYGRSLRTLESYQTNFKENNILDLNEIQDEVIELKRQTKGILATDIKFEYKLYQVNSKNVKVSIKIGQKRMYVLNNIAEFYEAYKNGTELYYGKQLKFIPKRENFAKESQEMFDFIIRYAQMIEYNKRYNEYGMSTDMNKNIYLSGDEIDTFFKINGNKLLALNVNYDREDEIYEFSNDKLNIACVLKKEFVDLSDYTYYYYYYENSHSKQKSEEYTLSLNIENYLYLISRKKIYIFYKEKIYTTERNEGIEKALELFDSQNKMLIPEDKIEEIKKYVISQFKNVQLQDLTSENAKEGILVGKLASKILLDVDDKGNILLELKFCYDDAEFNVLENGYKTYVKEKQIVRDIPAETEVIKRIFMDGFEFTTTKKEFIMKEPDNIYYFLLNKIEGYMNDYEVLATDKFKNKQIKQPKISNIGIKVNNDLLEVDLSKINIDMEEVKEILKEYKIKKKYYKLKNGDFLDLNNSKELDLLDEMAVTLDVDYSKVENGIINLPVSRSFYLEKLSKDNQEINVSKNEKFTEIIDNIGNSEISDKIKLDKDFKGKLRDYQKTGYKWLRTLESYKLGGILADDMGLGKTLQIIALLKSSLKSQKRETSIVVCPSTLVFNWKAEIEKWCNSMSVLIINGNAEQRKEKIENCLNYDLIITSYDLLKRDIENYEEIKFKYIIADEAQYIKNSSTQNATSLKSLKGETKFALTGTPIENSIAELWSIFDFIMPGYLYNYNKFRKKFEEPILKFEDKETLNRLKRLISPFVLRRIKKDVLTELPEKNIIVMKNEMEPEQEKIYLSYLAQTKKELAEELKDNGFEKNKLKILMLLTRLRQICCHPSLFIENYKGTSGKLEQCMDLVSDAVESGHKILIFSSYTSMFDILEKELEKKKIKYFKLVGNTPVSKRVEMVDEFNNSEDVKIFLISLKAGGTGLNLTSADVVIHYDPWWNISSENQATDRAYRIGQKNSVQVYKLITTNSIEEKINKMQERKENLSKDILSTEETFISKMSKEEILDLFE